MPASTYGSFTSTGQSAVVHGDNVDVLISGTFTASVTLQAEDAQGNWIDVPAQSHTAPAFANSVSAGARNWRLNCSAYTSGTAVYELSAATRLNRR